MAQKRCAICFSLNASSSVPLYTQIYHQIVEKIEQGAISAGEFLPSIRGLATEYHVSHTTVEQAYLQLAVEGYVKNISRSGYMVEELDTAYFASATTRPVNEIQAIKNRRSTNAFYNENERGLSTKYDFSYANLQSDSFPVDIWRNLTNEVLYTSIMPQYSRYSSGTRPALLSKELSKWLAKTRGIECEPEQVIIGSGTASLLTEILCLFDQGEFPFGIEEPGYPTAFEVAKRLHFDIETIPVDFGAEAFMYVLEEKHPRLIYTTPSHQFPTGSLAPVSLRVELLKWAEKNQAYIIEDDSCNEFRYNTVPVPSLYSMDKAGRVIYLSNFSKSLSPSLRVSYCVLPPKILEQYYQIYNNTHTSVSDLTQEILGRFICEGYWEQLIRKIAKGNSARHDILLDALTETMSSFITIKGQNAGMHFYLNVDNGMNQAQLIESARKNDVGVYGTERMYFNRPAPKGAIMLGFSAIAEEDIRPGVKALAKAWMP